MPTYGRYGRVCRALSLFLAQSAIRAAELVIYNQHDVPLRFDHPNVRVVNEAPPSDAGMHEIVQRAFELASDDADYVHKWDDDDLYMPWFLACGLEQIGTARAWKPREVLSWLDDGRVRRFGSWLEGTWLIDRRAIPAYPVHGNIRHTGHPVYAGLAAEQAVLAGDVGVTTPYVYMWEGAIAHASETGAWLSQDEQRRSIERFRQRNQDIRPDGLLQPADLGPTFRKLLGDIETHLGPETAQAYRRPLSAWL